MRIFLALRLSEKDSEAICSFQNQCLRIYQTTRHMTRRENLHITLEYIGEKSQEEVERMKEALFDFPSYKEEIVLEKLSYFHWEKKPVSVLLAKPEKSLMDYRTRLLTHLQEQGCIASFRPNYTPHLTLFRNLDKRVVLNAPRIPFTPLCFTPTHTSLMLSTRIDDVLTYLPLFDFRH